MKTFIIRSFIGIFFGGFITVLVTNLTILFGDVVMIDGSLRGWKKFLNQMLEFTTDMENY